MPAPGAPVIFISYRREETEDFTGLLVEKLSDHFGPRALIFWDHGEIDYGDDFPRKIKEAVGLSKALVAVIGGQWLEVRDKETGGRRLENEKDFVRMEIATALEAGVRVIPVLVKDAPLLKREALPENLKSLADRNALVLRGVKHLNRDIGDLIEALEKVLPEERTPDEEHEIFKMFRRYENARPTEPEKSVADTEPPPVAFWVAFGFVLVVTLVIFMTLQEC